MDLYALADQLLTLTVEQLVGMGIVLPTTQYVAPGPIPAWDGEQVTAHVVRTFAGEPGAEQPVQGIGYVTHAAEFSIVIVRDTPTPDDQGNPPSPAAVKPSVQANLADLSALQTAFENIKIDATWVDHATPFAILPVVTVGPEGGLVAVSGSVQIGVYS